MPASRARTALGMLLLSEAPIRIDSLAKVEIGRQLAPDLRTISLSAHETKEGASDQRCLSDRAVAALRGYISRHRSLEAPAGETMLFVADDGASLSGDHLSRKIGDHCEKRFGRRSTAHPFRNAAVSYIVGEAPEEADLAPQVINHSGPAMCSPCRGTVTTAQPSG